MTRKNRRSSPIWLKPISKMSRNKISFVLLLSLVVLVACGPAPTAVPTMVPPTAVPVEPTNIPSVAPTSKSAPAAELPTETIAPTTIPASPEPPAGLSAEQKEQAKNLINTNCSVCHSVSRIAAAQKDQAGWVTTVNRMLSKGTALTADEAALVIQYLAEGNKP